MPLPTKGYALLALAEEHIERAIAYDDPAMAQAHASIGLALLELRWSRINQKGEAVVDTSERPPEPNNWLGYEEVAQMLQTSVETVRYWRHMGTGPKSFKIGRRVRFERSAVEEWIANNRKELR